jgi:peptidoglycan/LPS O-acetylase OafA/YrhL
VNKFVALDGMRGLAALFVVTRHTHFFWGLPNFHSYLAVDVFFLLSGFVIAHSYEERLTSGSMTTGGFVTTRLIRLYPMYLLSLALALFVHGTTISGVLLVPTIDGGFMYPHNSVYWSLFFELLVNLIYVLARPVLRGSGLMVVIVAAGILVLLLERTAGSMDIGWKSTPFHFIAGFSRAAFGIFLGVWLYRNRVRVAIGPYAAIMLVCLTMCIPDVGRLNWVLDFGLIALVYPICILAATQAAPGKGLWIMGALGAASYPIYLLHIPLDEMAQRWGWMTRHAPVSGLLFMLALLAGSVALERYIDLPLRRKLTKLVRDVFVDRPRSPISNT